MISQIRGCNANNPTPIANSQRGLDNISSIFLFMMVFSRSHAHRYTECMCHFDERRNLKTSKDFSYCRNDSQISPLVEMTVRFLLSSK
ncbi:hypothetical protein THIOM_001524 [Candidatus Thiomargarita nelsonii]|uniref:Uncharacterized protein n=1 Tax=Candidatus Thiomargarita nelsonii TaxID=1003181 RepID=A0A176S3H3_9GAMM|nr:hypothetical protein THIOM_001524 [Candidatus Thiomargarita nelsonii]